MLLMLLQKPSVYQMSRSRRLDLIVLQATDGPIHFEHGQCNLVKVGDSVLTQSLLQIIHTDVFSSHVRRDHLAIVDQQTRLALDQFSEAAIPPGGFSNDVIHHQQRGSGDNSAQD